MEDLDTQLSHARARTMLQVRKRLDRRKKLHDEIAEFKTILADPARTHEHAYTAKCLAKAAILDEKLSLLIQKHLRHLDLQEESLKLQFQLLDTL
ncbi:hypothetical protein IVB22_10750 [Bradyrhizobium sp. 190]|uniref:hypothetical protein n=1 Tax=Bradyrhizobium sp. 190 TaxID=2782658 RepID=UPI001FF77778|nr:hypothetical protein [Bradyrhizobium sp. 190]MCK1513043.1 hypothetical protein [Bradyrhizobium sp. 190]